MKKVCYGDICIQKPVFHRIQAGLQSISMYQGGIFHTKGNRM